MRVKMWQRREEGEKNASLMKSTRSEGGAMFCVIYALEDEHLSS